MTAVPVWLPFVFVLIALLYAAAGFGGGSAYLAVLALAGTPYVAVPQIALVCNVVVSGGGVWHFRRGGHLDLGRVLPFFVLSVPLAYAGGRIPVGRDLFYALLGGLLVLSGALMMLPVAGRVERRRLSKRDLWLYGVPLGGLLGLVSGVVGIGGGVFLAPVLFLSGWTTPKQTAAAASLFIFVNSVAGLAGQLVKGVFIDGWVALLAAAALVGGQAGSRAGSYRLSSRVVRTVLAGVILVVGARLLWRVFEAP